MNKAAARIPTTKLADDHYVAHHNLKRYTVWMEDGTDGGVAGRWVVSYNCARLATAPTRPAALELLAAM